MYLQISQTLEYMLNILKQADSNGFKIFLMRGNSFTPDPENGYKRERKRDALARNPREKWAQNLGIRPPSQPDGERERRIPF